MIKMNVPKNSAAASRSVVRDIGAALKAELAPLAISWQRQRAGPRKYRRPRCILAAEHEHLIYARQGDGATCVRRRARLRRSGKRAKSDRIGRPRVPRQRHGAAKTTGAADAKIGKATVGIVPVDGAPRI